MLTKKEKLALIDVLETICGFQCAFEEETFMNCSYREDKNIMVQRGHIKMVFDGEQNYEKLIKEVDKKLKKFLI